MTCILLFETFNKDFSNCNSNPTVCGTSKKDQKSSENLDNDPRSRSQLLTSSWARQVKLIHYQDQPDMSI